MKKMRKRAVAVILALSLLISGESTYTLLGGKSGRTNIAAAEKAVTTAITSMDYYDAANGATQTKSGVEAVSYGFVMPKFNGKTSQELALPEVEADLQLYIKQQKGTNGEWKKIDDVSYFIYNSTWGWEHQQWSDTADGWICWFRLDETTQIRFHGITNNINLDYTFTFNKLNKLELTSISAGSEANITSDSTGGSATHWNLWTFNGNPSVTYDQIKDDLEILVDNHDGKGFVQFLANADSGFIWDQNFGIYTDGYGGYWFLNIDWSFTLRFKKKNDSSIYTDVNVTYNEPVRTNWTLTAFADTKYDSKNESHTASVAIVLPKIGGTEATRKDLDLFTYEICVGATYNNGAWSGGEWVALNDVAVSGWIYQGNGYSKYSDTQQWGYFVDHVYGLWFRPVKKDTYIRIGYPKNGQDGGDVGNNYVYYTFIGDPDAIIPEVEDMGDIEVDDNDDSEIATFDGWSMIWNDEFDGNTIDDSKWSRQTGYLLDEYDITTYGWGNNELQHYTDSDENSSVHDGNLNITMKKGTKTFAQADDPSKTRTALYASGKLVTKDKFSVKYGRVDFRAKLPTGTGVWPAMWMMPNDDRYGTWASSGEIDVFEGRGRVPNMAFGTIHFGSQWPGNVNASDMFDMVENGNKKTDFSDWHVYSLIWEEDSIKIYCDGKCYFKCTNAEWYSGADRGNANAPFDQRFYLIINLAAGGNFDNGYAPNYDTFEQADMYVDYVRVYQRQVSATEDEKPDTNVGVDTNGTDDNLYGDYKLGEKASSGETETSSSNEIDNETTSKETTGEETSTSKVTVIETTNTAETTGESTSTVQPPVETTKNQTNETQNGVNKKIKVSKIKIRGISKKIAVGKKIKLTAKISPKNATQKAVKWSSSNKKYATVNSKGWVKTKKAGKNKTVKIVATAKDGSGVRTVHKIKIMPKAVRKITLKVKVGTKPVSVKARTKTISVRAGKKLKIKAYVTPSDKKKVNKKLKWSSSNKKYATVNSKGLVKTKKLGKGKTVKITAKATDGSKRKRSIIIKLN